MWASHLLGNVHRIRVRQLVLEPSFKGPVWYVVELERFQGKGAGGMSGVWLMEPFDNHFGLRSTRTISHYAIQQLPRTLTGLGSG